MIRHSIDVYMRRDFKAAIDCLNRLPEDLRNPRLFAYRASVLLAVGRVDEARKDIDAALSIAPTSSDALALKSIIATVRNEKAEALSLAKKAVDADLKSASARVALSYAMQAEFNLEGALNTLKKAVQIDPENALAWARLSEMWLSSES